MPENRVEDDGELQVVKAAEPFEVFFRREFPKMVAVAYAVSGSRWAAEELAQEAFLRAHRSWKTIWSSLVVTLDLSSASAAQRSRPRWWRLMSRLAARGRPTPTQSE